MLVFITLRTPSNKLLYHSKAELSFLCIYAFLYLILAAFCVFVLLKKAGGCRAVYITLLVSLSCSTISTVASVFNLVIQQGGITLPQSSASGHTMLALSALVKLFNVWSLPFLFLSIYLLIRDGHLAVQKTHNSSVILIASYVLFALIMVFGTVAVGLYLDYLSIRSYISKKIGSRLIQSRSSITKSPCTSTYHTPSYHYGTCPRWSLFCMLPTSIGKCATSR